jgi:ATP-binding cassette subfamily F protein 3
MDSIDALAEALKEFKGGIVIVSHDQQFLDTVCNEVWLCEKGSLQKFNAGLGFEKGIVYEYKKSLLKEE